MFHTRHVWYFAIFSICFAAASCSSDRGQISADLDFDSNAVAQGTREAIEAYVFIVEGEGKDSGVRNQVLFPESCLSCSTGGMVADCASADLCANLSGCAISASEASIEIDLNFDFFAASKLLDVTACALDANSEVVSSGEGSFVNEGGETLDVIFEEGDVACSSVLPAAC